MCYYSIVESNNTPTGDTKMTEITRYTNEAKAISGRVWEMDNGQIQAGIVCDETDRIARVQIFHSSKVELAKSYAASLVK